LKVAIVCDWLVGVGGAERVVLELHKMYPDAPIYTSQYNPSKLDWFKDADVRTLWLQKLPKGLRKFLPPLRFLAFRYLNLKSYDLIISSSGAEAKAVRGGKHTVHINYCHSPTHYYWVRYEDYLKEPGFGRLNFLARFGLRLLVGPMRRLDYKAAQNPDFMIANSNHTAQMIKKYYHRDATVIHPPVDIERFAGKSEEHRRGFVTAGRQVPYKRIDLAVRAFTELDMPLLVLGDGPEHRKLKRIAGRKVTFKRSPSDEEVAHYFKTSLAFIFPGMDDFGIVAVEAMAAGTPVIAYKLGGALDYVVEGETGLFFEKQTTESLAKTISNFYPDKFSNEGIKKFAKKFSSDKFRGKMGQYIESIKELRP
jgi:glycosyltransferase involved in cell wall biosynthesis